MSNSIVLKNPPVIEAVIDIIFGNPLATNFEALNKSLSKNSERKEFVGRFQVIMSGNGSNPAPQLKEQANPSVRYFFESGSEAVLVKPEGVTFSRLKPYKGFDAFFNRVQTVCSSEGLEKFGKVQRVGLRYVNVFLAPVSSRYAEEYLPFTPRWPDSIPSKPNDFISRVALPLDDLNATCILTQACAPTAGVTSSSQMTLDIDILKDFKNGVELKDVWGEFSNMKAKLNETFFRSISKKALDLFL